MTGFIPYSLDQRYGRRWDPIVPISLIFGAGVTFTRLCREYADFCMHGGFDSNPNPKVREPKFSAFASALTELGLQPAQHEMSVFKQVCLIYGGIFTIMATLYVVTAAFTKLYSLKTREVVVRRMIAPDGSAVDRQAGDVIEDLGLGPRNELIMAMSESITLTQEQLVMKVEYGQTDIPTSLFCNQPRSHMIMAIVLPDTVVTIQGGAFRNCTALYRFKVPELVTRIEAGVFEGCTSLHVVDFGKAKITVIMRKAFNNCTALIRMAIPPTVDTIEDCAFCNCTSLTTLTFPPSVITIWLSAIVGCTALCDIVFEGTPTMHTTIHPYIFTPTPSYNLPNLAVIKLNGLNNIPNRVGATRSALGMSDDAIPDWQETNDKFCIFWFFGQELAMFLNEKVSKQCTIVLSEDTRNSFVKELYRLTDPTPDDLREFSIIRSTYNTEFPHPKHFANCNVIKSAYLSPYDPAGLYAAKTCSRIADMLMRSDHTRNFRPLAAAYMERTLGLKAFATEGPASFAIMLLRTMAPDTLTYLKTVIASHNRFMKDNASEDDILPPELWTYICGFLTRADLQAIGWDEKRREEIDERRRRRRREEMRGEGGDEWKR